MKNAPKTVVRIGDVNVALTRPLPNRPRVIAITTSDGRSAVLGDEQEPLVTVQLVQPPGPREALAT